MSEENDDRQNWQKNLLPLMSRMTVVLTAFFLLASLGQLTYLHWKISEPAYAGDGEISTIVRSMKTSPQQPSFETHAAFLLEEIALERRYHQANVLLMSRVWTRYLGFVTGMILGLIGAIFILGKLDAPESEASGELANAKFFLKSASPGVVLTGLGTLLMVVTIINHHEITVNDRPVYIGVHSNGFEAHDVRPSLSGPPAEP